MRLGGDTAHIIRKEEKMYEIQGSCLPCAYLMHSCLHPCNEISLENFHFLSKIHIYFFFFL